MNDKGNKSKKQIKRPNPLEALKDIGSDTAKSFKNDLLAEGSRDFMKQLLGNQRFPGFPMQEPRSGEIAPGEAMKVSEALSGEREERKKLEEQLAFERMMRQEEQVLFEKKGRELQLEIHAILEEVQKLAQSTPQLAQEMQVAAIQAPVNPGIYHVIFFEKLLETIRSFRQKIDDSVVWLQTANKRAQKKGFWGQYQKHGGRRLLSGEDYSQRSAG